MLTVIVDISARRQAEEGWRRSVLFCARSSTSIRILFLPKIAIGDLTLVIKRVARRLRRVRGRADRQETRLRI